VAALLDETMRRVEERTGTVDSHRLATLTGLNLAREVLELREALETSGFDPRRLRSLVDRVESALDGSAAAN
jgi:cell division protein ZapA (FtsZ GTPase activity inhibitor)